MRDDLHQHLIAGGDDPFLPHILREINHAAEIDIAVAFIRQRGLDLLFDAFTDAVQRKAKLRVLTGDYLDFTEPQALRHLMILQETGALVKVFETTGDQSFHLKTYIFTRGHDGHTQGGIAYVGSSNITYTALVSGLEWNLGVRFSEDPYRFNEIRQQFERLFTADQARPLTHQWIDSYQKRVAKERPQIVAEAGSTELVPGVRPHSIQQEVLSKLRTTRHKGFRRGLVVMATGLGKTYLAALDTRDSNAGRVLFVAHREEILDQAEKTFLRIRPDAKIGRYMGTQQDTDVDMLFASIQTLGRQYHLDNFPSDYFDYIVVDEFHHASARTYQRLLSHFEPKFLLGLTATPERTDQADILSLCDDNLVCQKRIKDGIDAELLCPFTYWGVADTTVDYRAIPWRSGKFDPTELQNQLATHARASHALERWRALRQRRTLAFCLSTRHADFMADYFNRHGQRAVSVHSESNTRRNEALERLRTGDIEAIFSVDLFNEGIDLPAIDTVMMLRPTESKILFLQQLGRGLRTYIDKERLVVIDFIGNHISFFRKLEALFNVGVSNRERRAFVDSVRDNALDLPEGCHVNLDLETIDVLEQLVRTQTDTQEELYRALKDALGRRPTLGEFYQAGGGVSAIRREHGQWFGFLASENDLDDAEAKCLERHKDFFLEVETTQMTKSFKMVLLEALTRVDGFVTPTPLEVVALESYRVLQRRRAMHPDSPEWVDPSTSLNEADLPRWIRYWNGNPVNAWVGGNRSNGKAFFSAEGDSLHFRKQIDAENIDTFMVLLQELVNYRFAQYEQRLSKASNGKISQEDTSDAVTRVPYFTDLQIACGHFAASAHEDDYVEHLALPRHLGSFDAGSHFVAVARGESMDGGDDPIRDGDYLLLSIVDNDTLLRSQGSVFAVQKPGDDEQFVLRRVRLRENGTYELIADNPRYDAIAATDDMRVIARLDRVLSPLDVSLYKAFQREEIPALFGLEFNSGLWHSGHVRPRAIDDQILLVTLNKQGKAASQQYHDYFIDRRTFHWQTQAATKVRSAKGQAIITHQQQNSRVHLFVRKHKLERGKSAPFIYCGRVSYKEHDGEKPMNVVWQLENPAPEMLLSENV